MLKTITLLTTITAFLSFGSAANTNQGKVSLLTKSVASSKSSWNKTDALQELANTKESLQEMSPYIGKLRAEVLKEKRAMSSNSLANDTNVKAKARIHQEFTIYQGFAELVEDYDEDGFYQTFAVTFDADVHNHEFVESARVYAELYLSKNGGDWVHYYTTENFNIYGESQDDEFQVFTTLDQGYAPDYYDVLIDLYEVGYNDVVATYSSDDTNDLYALPLESSDYDPEYVAVVVEPASHSHGHGGSLYFLALLVSIIAFVRMRA